MARVELDAAQQIALLNSIRQSSLLSQGALAVLCRVHPRTMSDWCRGRTRIRYESFQTLLQTTGVSVPNQIVAVPEYSHVQRAARLGAAARYRLHGNPGTLAGRKLGGHLASAKLRGALSDNLGSFRIAKAVRDPKRSPALAEFIGIMLGDGCVNSRYQISIYFNSETDRLYANFLQSFIVMLFGVDAGRFTRANSHEGKLLICGKRVVDHLISHGLRRANKVAVQADVPKWIASNKAYSRHCLRGLIDTDGSVYAYSHAVYGRSYTHTALCFTNRSLPLVRFVAEALEQEGWRPVMSGFRVYLHRQKEIEQYFAVVGTHNPKHLRSRRGV